MRSRRTLRLWVSPFLVVALAAGSLCIQGGEAPTVSFVRADANADGTVDMSDSIYTLWWLFLGGPAPPCPDAADANDDGIIDISDGIYSLGFLFLGGPAPPAPYPSAGSDPTQDTMECAGCVPTAEICDGVDNDCDGFVDDGFFLLGDPENCGECGNVCGDVPHAVNVGCVEGECVVLACEPYYADEDGEFDNGCEVYVPPVSGPNLAIAGVASSIVPAIIQGQSPDLLVTIANTGDTDLSDVELEVLDVSYGNRSQIAWKTGIQVLAGDSTLVTCSWPNVLAAIHQISVFVDPTNQLLESDEMDNLRIRQFTVFPVGLSTNKPNLALSSDDITFTPERPVAGDNVTITARVRKGHHSWGGTHTFEVTYVDELTTIVDNELQTIITVLGTVTSSINLDSQDWKDVSLDWINVPAGLHRVALTVDPQDLLTEVDELDNTAAAYLHVSTLTATGSASPPSVTAPRLVAFTGAASGGTPPYRYHWDFDDSTTSGAASPDHVYSLAHDASVRVYNATLTVTDADGHLATATVPVTVNPSGAYTSDLIPYIDGSTEGPDAGTVNVLVRVVNHGTSAVRTRLTVGIDLRKVYDDVVQVPAAVGMNFGEIVVTVVEEGLAAGNHSARAYVNLLRSVREDDYSHNEDAATITVSAGASGPPVEVDPEDVVIEPDPPVAGEFAEILVNVRNNSAQQVAFTAAASWESLSGDEGGFIAHSRTLQLAAGGQEGELFIPWLRVPHQLEVRLVVNVTTSVPGWGKTVARLVSIDFSDLEVVALVGTGGSRTGQFELEGDRQSNGQLTNASAITIAAPVKNQGRRREKVWAVFSVNGTEIDQSLVAVSAGETANACGVWQNPTAGTHTIRVDLSHDPPSTVELDMDPSNDWAELPSVTIVQGPYSYELLSYVVSPLKVNFEENIWMTVRLKNTGTTDRNFPVSFYLRHKKHNWKSTTETLSFPVEAGRIGELTRWIRPGTFIGRYALGVEVLDASAEDTIEVTPVVGPGHAEGTHKYYAVTPGNNTGLANYQRLEPGTTNPRVRTWAVANVAGKVVLREYVYKTIRLPPTVGASSTKWTTNIYLQGGFAGLIDTFEPGEAKLDYFVRIKYGIVEEGERCWSRIPGELWAVGGAGFNGLWKKESGMDEEDLMEELGWTLLKSTVEKLAGGAASTAIDLVLIWYDAITVDERVFQRGEVIIDDVALESGKTYQIFIGMDAYILAAGAGTVYLDFYNHAPHSVSGGLKGLWVTGAEFEFEGVWWGL